MTKHHIQGYEIREEISLSTGHFVLGHSSAAPSPYGTWERNQVNEYRDGHYFTDENQAREDLFTRALRSLPEHEAMEILLSNLSEERTPEPRDTAITDHGIKEHTATLKISPEEMEIINDILSMPGDKIHETYGPFTPASGCLSFQQPITYDSKNKYLCISIIPKGREGESNRIHIDLYTPGTPTPIRKTLTSVQSLEQIYSITDPSGHTWQLDLHADERLRRIGREFTFTTDSPDFPNHEGKTCTIQRMLNKDENTMLETNLMWKARFADGTTLDVFDSELSLPQSIQQDLKSNPEQIKPIPIKPLREKINQAQQQTLNPTQISQPQTQQQERTDR